MALEGAWAAALALVFVLVGLALIVNGEVASIVIGFASLTFFGFGFLRLLVAVAKPPIVLCLDSNGIHFGGLIPSRRKIIPWDALAGVRIFEVSAAPVGGRLPMLGLLPKDGSSALWRQGSIAVGAGEQLGCRCQLAAPRSDWSLNKWSP